MCLLCRRSFALQNDEQHELFLREIILIHEKSLGDVVAIVGDNTSIHQKLSAITNIPLSVCASNKLNLAIEK